jgi:hypothetical protein
MNSKRRLWINIVLYKAVGYSIGRLCLFQSLEIIGRIQQDKVTVTHTDISSLLHRGNNINKTILWWSERNDHNASLESAKHNVNHISGSPLSNDTVAATKHEASCI